MTNSLSADEALQRLKEGNKRFRAGGTRVRGMSPQELARLAEGQKPFATIIGCSDSRVTPELIFDAVLGELFVIRVAGNVLSSEIAGSLQYAGTQLRTPLLLVLGHSGCGAVHAALDYRSHGQKQRSRIQVLVDSILPAFRDIDETLPEDEQLARAVTANVRWTIKQVLESEAGEKVAKGEYKLKGAIYDIVTGSVQFLADEGTGG
jgi:carbonic anhydrase